jgi:hypothetical protein
VAGSYCCECHAPPGGCDHAGNRYLSPVKYEHLGVLADGRPTWKAPAADTWRMEHPPSSWQYLDPHEIDYGGSEVETFAPVDTPMGEHARQTGMKFLGARYRELAERTKRRKLHPKEREELDSIERALSQLQAMAPVAPLRTGNAGGPLSYLREIT